MNKIDKINKGNVSDIKKVLSSKGIAYKSNAKKQDLQNLVSSNAKNMYIGVKSGSYYFGTKKNTHAGNVARLIALREVNSKSDIRKKYTSKYSFKQTLERLNSENIISFTDKKHSTFELTEKGIFLADKLVNIYG
jgi:hypothetical protein